MFPAGSRNQAMVGPSPPRAMPFSSWSKPSNRAISTPDRTSSIDGRVDVRHREVQHRVGGGHEIVLRVHEDALVAAEAQLEELALVELVRVDAERLAVEALLGGDVLGGEARVRMS